MLCWVTLVTDSAQAVSLLLLQWPASRVQSFSHGWLYMALLLSPTEFRPHDMLKLVSVHANVYACKQHRVSCW
jgi:hypothetical protein